MVDPLISLIAASIAFVGTHFAMSHPLRALMVRLLGDGGFMIAYSLVSAATMAWMYFAFVATPAGACSVCSAAAMAAGSRSSAMSSS